MPEMLERWSGLTADELLLLEATFRSSGGSRHGMAERPAFSKSKTHALIAGLVDQGLLAEAGLQPSSGGRRAENLQLSGSLGVLLGIDIGVPGPVNFQSSQLVDPPLMPAWDGSARSIAARPDRPATSATRAARRALHRAHPRVGGERGEMDPLVTTARPRAFRHQRQTLEDPWTGPIGFSGGRIDS